VCGRDGHEPPSFILIQNVIGHPVTAGGSEPSVFFFFFFFFSLFFFFFFLFFFFFFPFPVRSPSHPFDGESPWRPRGLFQERKSAFLSRSAVRQGLGRWQLQPIIRSVAGPGLSTSTRAAPPTLKVRGGSFLEAGRCALRLWARGLWLKKPNVQKT